MDALTTLWTIITTWYGWLDTALDEADPEWHAALAERRVQRERDTLLHMRNAVLAVAARIPADASDDFYAGYQMAIRATIEAFDAQFLALPPSS